MYFHTHVYLQFPDDDSSIDGVLVAIVAAVVSTITLLALLAWFYDKSITKKARACGCSCALWCYQPALLRLTLRGHPEIMPPAYVSAHACAHVCTQIRGHVCAQARAHAAAAALVRARTAPSVELQTDKDPYSVEVKRHRHMSMHMPVPMSAHRSMHTSVHRHAPMPQPRL